MPTAMTENRIGFTPTAMIFIALIVVGVYAKTLTYDFVNFDDPQYVYENPRVVSGLTAANVLWAFTNVSHMCWQPLTWLSHMLDCQLAGLDPAWPHTHNLLLHLINSLLLFVLLQQATGARRRSFFVAAMFAAHPLAVDTVAWISERKNLLATLFMLLALMAYVHYVGQKKVKHYLVALLFFAAGLSSKPSIITLPFVLLLVDLWPLKRVSLDAKTPNHGKWMDLSKQVARLTVEKTPFFVLSALYLFLFSFSLERLQGSISMDAVPLALRLANAIVSYALYLLAVIWPHNLAVYYPFPEFIPVWQIAAASSVILLATIAALVFLRRRPWFAVGWFWFLGTLVPVIGIAQVGLWPSRADRWVYMPMIGILAILAWGLNLFCRQLGGKRYLAPALMIALTVAYGVAANLQAGHWRDSVTLFQRTIAVTQDNYVAHDNLGLALAMKGRFDEAGRHFREALRIEPGFWKSHQNLGTLYFIDGRDELAVAHFLKALSGQPNSVRIYNNLGRVYARQGKKKEAVASFQRSLALDPRNRTAIENLRRLMPNE